MSSRGSRYCFFGICALNISLSQWTRADAVAQKHTSLKKYLKIWLNQQLCESGVHHTARIMSATTCCINDRRHMHDIPCVEQGRPGGAHFWAAHFQKKADGSNLLKGSIWNNEWHENDTCKFGFNNTEKEWFRVGDLCLSGTRPPSVLQICI